MNRIDRRRLGDIKRQADTLLNAPARVAPVVGNLRVLEAVLDDVAAVNGNREPRELAALIELADAAGEL